MIVDKSYFLLHFDTRYANFVTTQRPFEELKKKEEIRNPHHAKVFYVHIPV